MSVFDDQMDDWFDNDCQGDISDYDGAGNIGAWVDEPIKKVRPPNKVQTSMGRRRDLLAITKIEEFAAWAVSEGFTREPTKGDYEVLRLRWPKMQPYIFFKRDSANHATSQAEGTQLVTRWLRNRTEASGI